MSSDRLQVLRDEAEAILQAVQRLGESFPKALALLEKRKGRCVVSGMGKSGLVGRKISATMASLGTPSLYLHAGDALHGDLGQVERGDTALLLSNSGQTPEVVGMVPALQAMKVPIIAMTGKPDSPLGQAAAVILNTRVEREADPFDLAPTASTIVMMAVGDALAVERARMSGFTPKEFALFHPAGSLGKRLRRVRDIMATEGLPVVGPRTKVREAVIQMTEGRLGVAVVAVDGKVRGIFTDGDVRRMFTGKGSMKDLLDKSISSVMVKNPQTVRGYLPVMSAIRKMEDNAITVMPVLDGKGKLAGIIHLHELIRSGMGMEGSE